jgi:hypothetical protein
MGIMASKNTKYRAKDHAHIDSVKAGETWKWAFPGHGHRMKATCPICDPPSGKD